MVLMMNKHDKTISAQEAINILRNIVDSDGYRETDGDEWLGPRLSLLHDFILVNHRIEPEREPCPFCQEHRSGE